MNKSLKCFFKKIVAITLVTTFAVASFPTSPLQAEDTTTGGSFTLSFDKLSDTNGRADISLDWDEINFQGKENGTRYFVFRKDLGTGQWEARGRYADSIRVLNVYPDVAGSDGLSGWMNNLATTNKNVSIDVDKVRITDFNNNPTTYLYKNTYGAYNYDVVVFGFWDSNYGKDLSTASATTIEEFIDNDGGVIFGHDTIESTKAGLKPNFRRVVEGKTSIKASPSPTGTTWPNWLYSFKIKVQKQGSATTYPCDINGMSLIIPYSHTIGQIPTRPDAVYMGFEKYSKDEVRKADPSLDISIDKYKSADGKTDNTDEHYLNYFYGGTTDKQTAQDDVYLNYGGKSYNTNAYLTLEENVAFIQCGHSSGKTNIAEQMILANTIYALAKIYTATEAVDQILDTIPPAIPTRDVNGNLIGFNSTDVGNGYEYRVVAIPMGVEESARKNKDEIIANLNIPESTGVGENIKFSNTITTTVDGGLQKYRYYIDKNPTGIVTVDDISLEVNGTIEVPASSSRDTYIHVAAYDLANNVSETYSFSLWEAIQFYGVTEKFVDIDTGEEFQPSVTNLKLFESTYVPTAEKTIKLNERLTYEYVNSEPIELFVKEEESTNIITHYYKAIHFPLVTERYISKIRDEKGNVVEEKVIKEPITSFVKEGQVYTPKADVYNTESIVKEDSVDRYLFSNTDLSSVTVSTDENKNVITHYYDQLLTKTINVVEHIAYPEKSTISYPYDQDIVLKQGTNMDISLPVLNNHNFDGYYTIGTQEINSTGSNKIDVGTDINTINLTWLNEEPIYLHYTRKTGSATVRIINSYTKFPITSFETPIANVGENIIITDEYMDEALKDKDFSTYTDSYKLKEFLTVSILNEGDDNTFDVELTPREKTIIYYGIEIAQKVISYVTNAIFGDNTNINTEASVGITSGSAVSISTFENTIQSSTANASEPQELDREKFVFGEAKGNYNGKDSNFNLIDRIFSTWDILEASKNFFIDFKEPTTTNYVGYYRDPKIYENYTYEVNYINEYDNGSLISKQEITSVNVFDKPTIDVKEIKNLNINGESVDFEPSFIEITNPTLGTKTFTFDEDYLGYFNQVDSNGNFITSNYVVNIYYKPYVTVNYVEEFLKSDLETVTNTRTTTLKMLYDEVEVQSPRTKLNYDYLLYKVDGENVDASVEYPRIIPNKYNQTITATYRPIVYNLNITAYTVAPKPATKLLKSTRGTSGTSSESYYVSYQFDSIPANDTITISEPKFDGFSLQSLIGGSDLDIVNNSGIINIKADPQKVLASMLNGAIPDYSVNAVYDKPSVLTINHIDSGNGSTFKTENKTTVVGVDTQISVYEDKTRKYSSATLVGDSQSIIFANSKITVTPTLETQTVNIYYADNMKYNLTVTSSTGGTTTGTPTNSYFEDTIITVNAISVDGYEFDTWEINGVSSLDNSSSTLSFAMPRNAVTLKAIFKEINLGSDGTDNSGGSTGTDSGNTGNTGGSTGTDSGNTGNTGGSTGTDSGNTGNTGGNNGTDTGSTGGGSTGSIGSGTNSNDYLSDESYDAFIDSLINNVITNDAIGELNQWKFDRMYKPYIQGYPDKTMQPDIEISRSEFITIIYNLFGEDREVDMNTLDRFSDVSYEDWFGRAVAFSAQNNYIMGYSDGTFRPNDAITREELATIISRFVKGYNTKTIKSPFTDIEDSWAKDDIEKLYEKGLIYGVSSDKFNPKDDATRAQIVTLVNRLVKRPEGFKETRNYPDLPATHWAYDDMMNASNGGELYEVK